jgi:putative endonuclease
MSTDQRRGLGATGEQLAVDHLVRLGFAILERNYRTRFGELDVVAFGDRRLVFCEVKTRLAPSRSRNPLESVHARKRAQVRRIAGLWLAARPGHPYAQELRFDAIGVTLDRAGRLLALEHIEGAF